MINQQLKTVSADRIIEIQSDLFTKLQNGIISIEVLNKFINMSEKDRNELFGIKTTENTSSIEERLQYINYLFTKHCGNRHNLDIDIEDFCKNFNIKKANLEKSINFQYTIEGFKSNVTHKSMLSHENFIEIPLIQALKLVITILENNQIIPNCQILIFLTTKNKKRKKCILQLYIEDNSANLGIETISMHENRSNEGQIDYRYEKVLLKV